MSDVNVRELLRLVRTGDAIAAEELVRAYEPELRRAIRVRLTDARLRRLIDSVDICQSVLAGFFVRTAAGQYDVQSYVPILGAQACPVGSGGGGADSTFRSCGVPIDDRRSLREGSWIMLPPAPCPVTVNLG